MRIKTLLHSLIVLTLVSIAYGDGEKPPVRAEPGPGKVFLYTAKKLGIPILKASIRIENGSLEQGKLFYQISANVYSSSSLGFLFRMNNRFTSMVEAETCSPVRYVKEIDQEGLLIGKKNYLQTLTFDHLNKKAVVEKTEKKEKQKINIPPGTYDPLSMFARCYLKEELHPGQDIRMSIYDGVKLRQMVFHSKKERVKSKKYGEVEAVCLESTTSFSSFGDKEGIIRIWYTADERKIPLSMELDLPVGSVRFELEEMKEG